MENRNHSRFFKRRDLYKRHRFQQCREADGAKERRWGNKELVTTRSSSGRFLPAGGTQERGSVARHRMMLFTWTFLAARHHTADKSIGIATAAAEGRRRAQPAGFRAALLLLQLWTVLELQPSASVPKAKRPLKPETPHCCQKQNLLKIR